MKIVRIIGFSCLLGSISITASGQSTDTTAYFPLAIGNEWRYQSEEFTRTETIVDTVRHQGNVYFDCLVEEIEMHYHFRTQDQKVYLWHEADSSDVLLYDFTAAVGDTWNLPGDYACDLGTAISLADTDVTVETPFDTFLHCYRFEHQPSCCDAGIWQSWFAPGIGKVKYVEDFLAGMQNFELTECSILTSVQGDYPKKIPDQYRLPQNFPNPFNSATTIKYTLPAAGDVKIMVYDINGREIKTLFDGFQTFGTHTLSWETGNIDSGVYVYKIEAHKFMAVGKCLLLK